ncbi:putative TAT-binding protein [Wickerhamomyces ciferrii]|uniref:TAT-binding protein n=1 Tax=Wickerhamomyces ciferrii (strain ATCC 14091 / BCRC 22168 / CBS 111 / JCM 3599 / NBRC 0793 / NRRL Y-1031 F-60-10) TaxID=1206466 RepID=K0KJH7_WICCF|nr:putative TAT-binding protein [Wickerhamomyces ciferrii]CCH41644.1 putative TAT-binding protein [Wickerhamomyces ciferrii]
MGRPTRAHKGLPESDQDDEEDISLYSRRKKQRINYAEVENGYDQLSESDDEDIKKPARRSKPEPEPESQEDEDIIDSTQPKDEEDDDDDFTLGGGGGRSRNSRTSNRNSRSSRSKVRDDDDEFKESDEYNSEYISDEDLSDTKNEDQRRMRNFISKDDDETDDGEYYDKPKRRRNKKLQRGRSRGNNRSRNSRHSRRLPKDEGDDDESEDEEEVTLPNDDEPTLNDEEGNNTLQQELEDLKNDSDNPRRTRRGRALADSDNSPAPRSLRERKTAVNYTIPPPLTDPALELQFSNVQPSTPRRRAGAAAGPIRRLFPTGGPFGGGDVTSIFGKNLTHFNAGAATGSTGGNLLGGADSDSSDDEIIPVGGASAKRNSISAPVGMKNNNTKKQNAEIDPLGVDMNIDFTAIGGLDNYISQLKEMVALPLLYPEVYQRFGITPPRGVLFHGPPGTGKTLMARALAASCSSQGRNITFFMRKGADCLSKWVGEAERQLRLLFEEARKQQPSIIFFDEIDGLAPVRSSKQEQIHASIVSTMLALMDGMDNRGQVIVIGATNRPDAVDPALRRPGRFDREFYFPLPDIKAREQILKIHTKKWDPPLQPEFTDKVAHMTKGYGGADLRALCTEAALNSIQRRYPQIYSSDDKLKIDPSTIQVAARDFMKALDKIVPSSARSTSSGSAPLPEHLSSLLSQPLETITHKLDKIIPRVKKLSVLEEAQFIDPTENDHDGGFGKHELIKRLESSRVFRPRLLISGDAGNGQSYLGAAVLNHLEGFNVQSLDLGALFGDSTRTPETAIIQSFIEARRHQPSIIFIPNVDIWYYAVSDSSKATLSGLLRSVSSNEKILLLGLSETPFEELDLGLKNLFGLAEANHINLGKSNEEQREKFFESLWIALKMKPTEFLDSRKKRKLEKLEKIEPEVKEEKLTLKSFEKSDMKLKNTLKIKLSGLMDLFKNRYRKFKKPIIDDHLLIHLFEPEDENAPLRPYSKDGDMIVENATGRRYFNMDLDIAEERLWNGYYSEPKQFLKDIEMIYKDSVTLGDRERLIKASEMFANAQVGVEEIATPEFATECKAMRAREAERQRQHEEELLKIKQIEEAHNQLVVNDEGVNGKDFANEDVIETEDPSTAQTQTQIQTQAQLVPEGDELVNDAVDQSVISVGDVTINDADPQPVEATINGNGNSNKEIEESGADDGDITMSPKHPLNDVVLETKEDLVNGEVKDESTPVREEKIEEIDEAIAEPEPESESEPEPEEPEPPFELDDSRLEKLQKTLIDETDELTVEHLEQVNARLMDIIWEDHHTWNRNETLSKLSKELAIISTEL